MGAFPVLEARTVQRVLVYGEPVDFRKGHNGLMAITQKAGLDLWSGDMVVFFSRSGRKCKVIVADETGVWLHYKVLARGHFQQLKHLLCGDISQIQSCELELLLSGASYLLTKPGNSWTPGKGT